MLPAKLIAIFVLASAAEIAGCFLTYSYIRGYKPAWILLPAALSLGLFSWLLALPSGPAGRTYAAYGGIYVVSAVLWLWKVEGIRPDRWDLIGSATALIGMAIIAFVPRHG